MTVTIELPQDVAEYLAPRSQTERESYTVDAVSMKWSMEKHEAKRRADDDMRAWDAQIEADLAAGKLDALLAEVDAEIASGRVYDAPSHRPVFLDAEKTPAV